MTVDLPNGTVRSMYSTWSTVHEPYLIPAPTRTYLYSYRAQVPRDVPREFTSKSWREYIGCLNLSSTSAVVPLSSNSEIGSLQFTTYY